MQACYITLAAFAESKARDVAAEHGCTLGEAREAQDAGQTAQEWAAAMRQALDTTRAPIDGRTLRAMKACRTSRTILRRLCHDYPEISDIIGPVPL